MHMTGSTGRARVRGAREHNLRRLGLGVIAHADWPIDIGRGAADDGGRIVRAGAPG
jgi:excinuclease UvrABC ATPase subunit